MERDRAGLGPVASMATFALALPSGMLPPLCSRDTSLECFSRSPKHRAMHRCDFLPLQACARAVLRFLIARGRGKRCRSWWSARRIAESLPRSGKIRAYSTVHVRRALTQLEDAGLVRAVTVRPGERFPRGEAPDVDGGGELAYEGGRVREVNMGALLGDEQLWEPPVRRLRLVSQPASAFADVEGTDPEASAAVAALRGVMALEREAAERGEAAAEPSGASDHPCVGASDHPCRTDLGSPTENHHDPGRAAPEHASPAATRTTANAGTQVTQARMPPRPVTLTPKKQDERAGAREVACDTPDALPPVTSAPANGSAPPTKSAGRGREHESGQSGAGARPEPLSRGCPEKHAIELANALNGGQLFLVRRTP